MEKKCFKIIISIAIFSAMTFGIVTAEDISPLAESEMAKVFGGVTYLCTESKTDGEDCPTPEDVCIEEDEVCYNTYIIGNCERERRICAILNPYWKCEQFSGPCANLSYTSFYCVFSSGECVPDYGYWWETDCPGTLTYATDEQL